MGCSRVHKAPSYGMTRCGMLSKSHKVGTGTLVAIRPVQTGAHFMCRHFVFTLNLRRGTCATYLDPYICKNSKCTGHCATGYPHSHFHFATTLLQPQCAHISELHPLPFHICALNARLPSQLPSGQSRADSATGLSFIKVSATPTLPHSASNLSKGVLKTALRLWCTIRNLTHRPAAILRIIPALGR